MSLSISSWDTKNERFGSFKWHEWLIQGNCRPFIYARLLDSWNYADNFCSGSFNSILRVPAAHKNFVRNGKVASRRRETEHVFVPIVSHCCCSVKSPNKIYFTHSLYPSERIQRRRRTIGKNTTLGERYDDDDEIKVVKAGDNEWSSDDGRDLTREREEEEEQSTEEEKKSIMKVFRVFRRRSVRLFRTQQRTVGAFSISLNRTSHKKISYKLINFNLRSHHIEHEREMKKKISLTNSPKVHCV